MYKAQIYSGHIIRAEGTSPHFMLIYSALWVIANHLSIFAGLLYVGTCQSDRQEASACIKRKSTATKLYALEARPYILC